MEDILTRLENSSQNESSHELQCRCFDAAEEISRLRAMLKKARSGLSCGLWDYGPDQDEHKQCDTLLVEIDAVLAPNV